MIIYPQSRPDVFVKGTTTLKCQLSRNKVGGRAMLNALRRLVGSINERMEKAGAEVAHLEKQLADYKSEAGALFDYEEHMSHLAEAREQLKNALSATNEPKEGEPSIADAAEKVEQLLARYKIEDAKRRPGGARRAAGEEPITTRARRRIESRGAGNTVTSIAPQSLSSASLPANHRVGESGN